MGTLHQFNVPPKVVKGGHRGVQYELRYLPDVEDEGQRWQYVITVYTSITYANNAPTEQRCHRAAVAHIDELVAKGMVKR